LSLSSTVTAVKWLARSLATHRVRCSNPAGIFYKFRCYISIYTWKFWTENFHTQMKMLTRIGEWNIASSFYRWESSFRFLTVNSLTNLPYAIEVLSYKCVSMYMRYTVIIYANNFSRLIAIYNCKDTGREL
jgi:hypothetical protein